MAAPTQPRRGRKPRKGERDPLLGRVPKEHGAIYEARRKELGLSQADYVALRMAQSEGLPIPDYIADVIDISSIRPRTDEGGAVAI